MGTGAEHAPEEAVEVSADATRTTVRVLIALLLLLVAELLLWLCRPPMPLAIGWAMIVVAVIACLAATWLLAKVLVELAARHRRLKALEARNAAERVRMAAYEVNPGLLRHGRDRQ